MKERARKREKENLIYKLSQWFDLPCNQLDKSGKGIERNIKENYACLTKFHEKFNLIANWI